MPLVVNGAVIGVFDIDSPSLNRFDADDQAGIEQLVRTFLAMTDSPVM